MNDESRSDENSPEDPSWSGEGVADDSASSAGSESPEEGEAAMKAAEDATVDQDDD